ncbi:MAG: hypothetical protein K2M40_06585 [Muribaculaceae bacterium]|nr:hypothetical protein [Muribaculaceae bacterium]
MKKSFIIAAIAAALLTSCAPKVQYVASSSYINYQTYAEQGVFITESNSVNFEYTPLGSVSAVVFPGYVKAIRPSQYRYVDFNGNPQLTEEYNKWQSADVTDAIALAVEKAKQQGGNGIINFQVRPTSESDGKTVRHGFIVTGMVISK